MNLYGRSALLLLAAAAISLGGPPTASAQLPQQREADIIETGAALARRLEAGTADPLAEAKAAGDRGDFGLVMSGGGRGTSADETPGVLCHTPYRAGPSIKAAASWGDYFTEDSARRKSRYLDYAKAYNRAIIDHPRFPYADLCAPEAGPAPHPAMGGAELLSAPARKIDRRPMTLQEAARRGSLADVRAFLRRVPVDDLDDFNMTALAWAVAYGREDAANLLLKAGASPMPEGAGGQDITPVMAAITQRRPEFLARLEKPEKYTRLYVHAAIRSNDPAIIRAVLGAPHDPIERLHLEYVTSSAITVDVAQSLIELLGKDAADAVLYEGASTTRLDLVRLAVASGADVNAQSANGRTPLLVALEYYRGDRLAVVEELLAAGADVNQPPRPGTGFENPFWRAYWAGTRPTDPQPQIFERVVAAGGDARIPLRPGIPPVWTVVFMPSGMRTHIRAPSEDILRLLLSAGLDLNAAWEGDCVLDAVERLTGPQGDVAQTLRKLGARRKSPDGVCAL